MSQTFNVRGKDDRDRKRDDVLPDPPDYARWKLRIPPFYASYHPYTKWMLNMIRGNAIHRLATMIKERPIIFRHYFQIADSPETVTNNYRDHICMFHRRCVLYFTPLCLAVYLKRDKVVDILMKSGLNNPYQSCFATEVFITKPADILEICAACVALKREFFQALPLLCQTRPDFGDNAGEAEALKIDEPLCLRYVTIDAKRFFRYQDLLHYGTELLQRNANYPINRLVECLLVDCAEFYDTSKMREDAKGEQISLFRRLARFAFYQDDLCRVSLPVIACFETMLRNFCVPWKTRPAGKTCAEDPDFILKHLQSRNALTLDQDASLLLLSGLYHKLRTKSRGLSRLNRLGQVIYKFLIQMQWLPVFQNITLEDLQLISKDINECIPMTKQTLAAMQHHVSAIDETEKMREVVISNDIRSRRDRSRGFRMSCAHSAMPPPVLVGGVEAVPQLIGKEQSQTSVQQVTRSRRVEPAIQPQEGSTVFKYHHGSEPGIQSPLPPMQPLRRRHERGASEPNLPSIASGASEGLMFEGRSTRPPAGRRDPQYQDKCVLLNEPEGNLGDQNYDDLEDVSSVTDWLDLDSIMTKSSFATPTFLPSRRARGRSRPPPKVGRSALAPSMPRSSWERSHRRSTSWDRRAPPALDRHGGGNSINRRWSEFSAYRGSRRHSHRSAIDAYEKYVLGAMFEDYDCETSSQGDYRLSPPRRSRDARWWSQRAPRWPEKLA